MPAIPREFSELLTPLGRRILEGRSPWSGALADPARRFVGIGGAIDRRGAERLRAELDRALEPLLREMSDPIPEWTIRAMQQNYAELLPKTVRVRTAMLESRRAKAYRRAEELGLVALLRSASSS